MNDKDEICYPCVGTGRENYNDETDRTIFTGKVCSECNGTGRKLPMNDKAVEELAGELAAASDQTGYNGGCVYGCVKGLAQAIADSDPGSPLYKALEGVRWVRIDNLSQCICLKCLNLGTEICRRETRTIMQTCSDYNDPDNDFC